MGKQPNIRLRFRLFAARSQTPGTRAPAASRAAGPRPHRRVPQLGNVHSRRQDGLHYKRRGPVGFRRGCEDHESGGAHPGRGRAGANGVVGAAVRARKADHPSFWDGTGLEVCLDRITCGVPQRSRFKRSTRRRSCSLEFGSRKLPPRFFCCAPAVAAQSGGSVLRGAPAEQDATRNVAGIIASSTPSSSSRSASSSSLDFDFFKARVEPIFLKNRPGHARCYSCHGSGNGPQYLGEALARSHVLE